MNLATSRPDHGTQPYNLSSLQEESYIHWWLLLTALRALKGRKFELPAGAAQLGNTRISFTGCGNAARCMRSVIGGREREFVTQAPN
jgi:hypothetical protein